MYDFRGELFVEERGVHGEERVVAAMLDGAFAVTVYQYGALLGLRGGDAADVYKCFDDIVKSVDIIVVKDEAAARVFQHFGFSLCLGGYLG